MFAAGTMQVEARITSGPTGDSAIHHQEQPLQHREQPLQPKELWTSILTYSRFGDNVIRDSETGESIGYFVRKDDGGVNFYSYSTEDEEGGRIGYISGDPDFDHF